MIDKKVAVIGGGPAGMIACGRLKDRVKTVYLIEPNAFLGKKLRIT
jgi:predicted flavoprotein YhiN